ncbi:MAG: peptidylprolyl isomerase [Gammaproteobacteria bacterium]|nr:peptidylprolyl isomerase [Gammaproteobacteria bacterium]
MKIGEKCVVAIHYRLTDEEGIELDSSAGQDPLNYLHGAQGLIPGLERELDGHVAGDKLSVTVQPEDAYGTVDPELMQTVPRSAFGEVKDLEPGMQFEASGPDGQVQRVVVEKVSDDDVTINGNHPLAGRVLHFEVSIESVREASEEEVAHGHVH